MVVVVVMLVVVRTVVRRGKGSEMRKGEGCRGNRVLVVTSSAVLETEADDRMLQESLSAAVCAAHVHTAIEGYPAVP